MEGLPFTLPSGDRNAGTVYLPPDVESPVPVVISCHGWRSDQRLGPFLQALRGSLAERGAALVTFDFYGVGATGGNLDGMTYGRWEANLHDVVTYVLEQGWAGAAGCLGISSGSMVALRLADHDNRLSFLISVATSLGLQGRADQSVPTALIENIRTLSRGGTVNHHGGRVDLAFFQDLVRRAPAYSVERIPIPVLLLQGTKDNVWRRSDAWLAFQKRKDRGMPVRYVEVQGGDHGLTARPRVGAREVIRWLEEIGVLHPG